MDIIQQVKELIQRDNLDSKDRYRDMVYKRCYLYSILRDEGWHLSKIGRLFNRNHATVINALNLHDNYFGKDKIYDRMIKEYLTIFGKEITDIDYDKPTIYQDIINCHNTTALGIIKQRIKDGYYDKP
jgi:hypothetical protein